MSSRAQAMEALHLRDNRWVVRPAGCLGTCGWKGGVAWTARFVTTRSADEALRKAAATPKRKAKP